MEKSYRSSGSAADSVVAPHGPQPAPALRLGLLQATLSQSRTPKGVQPIEPLAASTALPVIAASSGPGTLCIRSTAGITEAGASVEVSPVKGVCRRLSGGQRDSLPLTLHIHRPLSGELRGSIVATTRWRYGTVSYSWTIPVTGTVVVPPGSPIVDQTTLWLLVIGSVVGAAVLWFLMCWWTALLSRKTRKIQHYTVDAILDATTNQATVRFDSPSQEDFVFVNMPNNHTRTALSQGLELKAPIRVFRPQDVIVGQPGAVVNGTLGSAGGRSSLKGRIEHRIQGQWVFTTSTLAYVAPDTKIIEGALHYFVLEDAAGTEQGPEVCSTKFAETYRFSTSGYALGLVGSATAVLRLPVRMMAQCPWPKRRPCGKERTLLIVSDQFGTREALC